MAKVIASFSPEFGEESAHYYRERGWRVAGYLSTASFFALVNDWVNGCPQECLEIACGVGEFWGLLVSLHWMMANWEPSFGVNPIHRHEVEVVLPLSLDWWKHWWEKLFLPTFGWIVVVSFAVDASVLVTWVPAGIVRVFGGRLRN